jgi:hypothetical protein
VVDQDGLSHDGNFAGVISGVGRLDVTDLEIGG